jgi:hypothetical protein
LTRPLDAGNSYSFRYRQVRYPRLRAGVEKKQEEANATNVARYFARRDRDAGGVAE